MDRERYERRFLLFSDFVESVLRKIMLVLLLLLVIAQIVLHASPWQTEVEKMEGTTIEAGQDFFA